MLISVYSYTGVLLLFPQIIVLKGAILMSWLKLGNILIQSKPQARRRGHEDERNKNRQRPCFVKTATTGGIRVAETEIDRSSQLEVCSLYTTKEYSVTVPKKYSSWHLFLKKPPIMPGRHVITAYTNRFQGIAPTLPNLLGTA